jgi:hypothetical protein
LEDLWKTGAPWKIWADSLNDFSPATIDTTTIANQNQTTPIKNT